MPTSKELVANKPLAGSDLAKIILADVTDMLDRDGLLSGHIAYYRASYEVRVTLHFDNPSMRESSSAATSRAQARDKVTADSTLAAIEPFPLADPSAESILAATERHREIESANGARMDFGLPIDILSKDQNGQSTEKSIIVPADAVEHEPSFSEDRDVTEAEAKRLDMPVPAEAVDTP